MLIYFAKGTQIHAVFSPNRIPHPRKQGQNPKPGVFATFVLPPEKAMPNNHPELPLHPSKVASIQRKHHWVFSGAIKKIPEGLKPGEWIYLEANGKIIASGFFNPGSIAVRIVAFEKREPTVQLFKEILDNSIQLRNQLLSNLLQNTNAFRLFHGEGDGLPGLVIDSYNGHLVVQAHHEGIDLYQKEIALS